MARSVELHFVARPGAGDLRRFQLRYRDPSGPFDTGFDPSHAVEVESTSGERIKAPSSPRARSTG